MTSNGEEMDIETHLHDNIEPCHIGFITQSCKQDNTVILLDPALSRYCQGYILSLTQKTKVVGFVMAILLNLQVKNETISGAAVTHMLIHSDFRGKRLVKKLVEGLIVKSQNHRPATYYFLRKPLSSEHAIPVTALVCILNQEKAIQSGYQMKQSFPFPSHQTVCNTITERVATLSDLTDLTPALVQVEFSELFFQSPWIWTCLERKDTSQKVVIAYRIINVISGYGNKNARAVLLSFLHSNFETPFSQSLCELLYSFLFRLQREGFAIVHAIGCGILAHCKLQRQCGFITTSKLYLEFYNRFTPPSPNPIDYNLLYT
jgi:hypothetical protein